MKTDVEIAAEFTPRPIQEIAATLGVHEEDLLPYGRDLAKVSLSALDRPSANKARRKLVLVSAITPTPAGEGKTTTTVGLGQAFTQLDKSVCLALREPSLGPCMGVKGGAAGGGYSQVMPMDRINLHLTGDFHAITSANNLLASLIDNHIYFGNDLGIDPRSVLWRRVMDLNDRSLRNIVLGLGGKFQGTPREGGFDITAASEVMAMLCLASDMDDLRARINRTLVAYTYTGEPVFAESLNGTGAMMALLRDALNPNLVQTFEGTPVLVHGGPFANIAHGCNSVVATKLAMHMAEWTLTEAGFGFDLGAEKFFDIKCRMADLDPDGVVLVATVRALKMHGGKDKANLADPDAGAVEGGLPNLEKHIESVQKFGKPVVVALNRFATDTEEEIAVIRTRCEQLGASFAESDHHGKGGKGAIELAKAVMESFGGEESLETAGLRPLYDLEEPVVEKIKKVARAMYGARDVAFTKAAEKDLKLIEKLGYNNLPICIAKAPSSLSDDPALRGRPRDFEVGVRNIVINSGAGFLVVLTGNIMRMPGLPRKPLAHSIDVVNGEIVGME
ncbi:MAG: formate--tetrahydrofolate ligase [Planctomycetota bacterium]|nr:formate--tetrahydrofolate ligase [Planctomycetota bacterium]MDG2142668.1 formate--tetrahydrofolate ligase [Planctomycetota bacterium]